MEIFRRCLEIAGKAELSEIFFGRMPKHVVLENAQSQQAEIPAMLLCIQDGPDDVLKIFGSGQVTDL